MSTVTLVYCYCGHRSLPSFRVLLLVPDRVCHSTVLQIIHYITLKCASQVGTEITTVVLDKMPLT